VPLIRNLIGKSIKAFSLAWKLQSAPSQQSFFNFFELTGAADARSNFAKLKRFPAENDPARSANCEVAFHSMKLLRRIMPREK
jgi:hypothetical protein